MVVNVKDKFGALLTFDASEVSYISERNGGFHAKEPYSATVAIKYEEFEFDKKETVELIMKAKGWGRDSILSLLKDVAI